MRPILTSLAAPLLGIVVLLGLPAAAASQPARSPDVPGIVVDGLRAYKQTGARAALAVWLKGSPAGSPGSIEQMVETLTPIEAAYGRVIGHEILRVISVSASVRRVYAIVKYDRGPLYAFFDCYETPHGWVIPGFMTNTKADEILPKDLLQGQQP